MRGSLQGYAADQQYNDSAQSFGAFHWRIQMFSFTCEMAKIAIPMLPPCRPFTLLLEEPPQGHSS